MVRITGTYDRKIVGVEEVAAFIPQALPPKDGARSSSRAWRRSPSACMLKALTMVLLSLSQEVRMQVTASRALR